MKYRTTPTLVYLAVMLILFVSFVPSGISARDLTPKQQRVAGFGQPLMAAGPTYYYMGHTRGNIQLAIANNGTFGTLGSSIADPITGESIPSCIYPKNTDLVYLWVAAVWIGGVVGRDTLVSVGNEDFYVTTEFWPVDYDNEYLQTPTGFKMRSIDINSPFYHPDAVSEEDIVCEYADTLRDPAIVQSDNFDNRPHIPLGIKVRQRSMAWSYSYADDFILFDYQIENIGERVLKDIHIGVYVDGDAWHTTRNNESGWNDDIVGFYPSHPAPEGCGFRDTINVAYHADNDGDPDGGAWNDASIPHVVGVRVVRTPAESPEYSYNWWITNYSDAARDFGPRQRPRPGDPYRDFGERMGTPLGDRNKYYLLRHQEFDYDLLYTATIGSNDTTWLQPPPDDAAVYATGFDCRYLLSFGPFDILPGQRLPVSFAWLGGEDFHTDPNGFDNLFDPLNPTPFYEYLNFENLAANSRWASWVYDNPGVDTDSDGYYGKYRVCVLDSAEVDTGGGTTWEPVRSDTTWFEGDGIPDFRGAGPPPAPRIRIIPSDGKLTIRWNGYYSETTEDVFLNAIDFEGYRVYTGRDDRPGSLSMVASFDHENYNRHIFNEIAEEWEVQETPYTLDSLRILYDDPDLDPLRYSRSRPLIWQGQKHYFTAQDFNRSSLTSSDGIRKVYPDQFAPDPDPANWTEDELVDDYGIPLPKYYEYEYVVEDLLSTVPYYVSVTAFDFGSPRAGLPALETDPTNSLQIEYAQVPADTVEAMQLDVYVYPNPYRIDADYRGLGFEGRTDLDRPDDRVRAIHFANLPHKCRISIFSLDGDLIKEIEHDKAPGDPGSSHEEWDLITRNTQAIASGLYYYVVESDDRTQIGKFAVIR